MKKFEVLIEWWYAKISPKTGKRSITQKTQWWKGEAENIGDACEKAMAETKVNGYGKAVSMAWPVWPQ